MHLELTGKQYRRLLDMVYIGNWILNSARGEDRIKDYDDVETLVFQSGNPHGYSALVEGELPSRAFIEGGIHEAVMDYEDTVFFEILAEELARRDLAVEGIEDSIELSDRIREYIAEFELNGTDNISLNR